MLKAAKSSQGVVIFLYKATGKCFLLISAVPSVASFPVRSDFQGQIGRCVSPMSTGMRDDLRLNNRYR